jgi:hypothetical protein
MTPEAEPWAQPTSAAPTDSSASSTPQATHDERDTHVRCGTRRRRPVSVHDPTG